jgi:hypothetical protein
MFALPQGHFDGHEGGLKCTASTVFRTYASGVIKDNGWKNVKALTLWAFLPEDYKSAWKAGADRVRIEETTRSAPSHTKLPKFNDSIRYGDSMCAYFTFQANAGPSTFQLVDTSNNDTTDTSAQASVSNIYAPVCLY